MLERRSAIIYFLVVSLFMTSVVRLLLLSQNTEIQAAANQNRMRVSLPVQRKTIYDCNLEPLTNTDTQYVAAVPPTDKAKEAILKFFPKEEADNAISRLNSGFPILINVPENFKADDIPCFPVKKRYSQNQIAPHVIGYLDGNNRGVSGIESGYDDLLTPENQPAVIFMSDAKGNVLSGIPPALENADSNINRGIALTINKELQQIAEASAKKYIESGAVIVLENKTGKIRALSSLPDFSPNNLAESINSASSPLINRAISAYNIGSVFKLCVAAAALESGEPETTEYKCDGIMSFADRTFRCMDHQNHGNVKMVDSLVQSCNIYFINLGQKIGADPIYNLAKSFGFGQSRQPCRGIVPDSGVLSNIDKLKQQPSALANFSFGQGDLMATPLQIAEMIAAIANSGKAITPSLIEGTVGNDGKIDNQTPESVPANVMSKSTADRLKDIMIHVVESGSGKNAQPLFGGAGGKTGTAETGWVKNGKNISQAWFAGFYPANDPVYSIVVIIEDGVSGGWSSAPVFKEIADGIYAQGLLP